MNAPANIITGWHVIYTAPRAELLVKLGIEELGIEAYLPLEKLRQKQDSHRLWRVIERPLFSRYMFARAPQDWTTLLRVKGVNEVLSNNSSPSVVANKWIEWIKKVEKFGLFDHTQPTAPFQIGETAKVSNGPFAGHTVTIEKFAARLRSSTAKKRAKVLLELLGQKVEADIDICDLEKINYSR